MRIRLRQLLFDGVILALPVGAAAYLVGKAIGLLVGVMAPVAHLLPHGRWFGIAALEIGAAVVLLAGLLLLGAFSRSPMGRRVAATLEDLVLGKLPGYLMVKTIAADLTGAQFATSLRPALVTFDDHVALGFVVEESGDTLTVFVSSAPSADGRRHAVDEAARARPEGSRECQPGNARRVRTGGPTPVSVLCNL